MKKIFKITFFVALAFVILISAFVAVSVVSSVVNHSASVGIIGGADGPTAVMVTRSALWGAPLFTFLCALLVVAAICAVGWLLTRKK